MQDDEIFHELFEKDREIGELRNKLYKSLSDVCMMKNTIENLIHMKCKRGESAYSLNISLEGALRENLKSVNLPKLIRYNDSVVDTVARYLLLLLIGEDRSMVPCCLIDSNNIVYKSDVIDTYVVCTTDTFIKKMYEIVSMYVMSCKMDIIGEEPVDLIIGVVNSVINERTFFKIMKKTLSSYKTA